MQEITDLEVITNELTMSKLRSDEFIIYTKEIGTLEAKILEIVMLGNCGACVVSRPRCGKTTAMIYISKSLKKRYGEKFPVIMWDITDHPVTERNFYSTLLTAMNVKHSNSRATALILKERVLNELVTLASDTPFKKVVLMVDEAWRLGDRDFTWLMDLYNILRRYGLQLITVFFSTNELLDIKKKFKAEGLDQIVERFFLIIYKFHGIREIGELAICLSALDKEITVGSGTEMLLRKFYFPNARETDRFFNLTDIYWSAFHDIRIKYSISVDDIPMEFVMGSFRILLGCYGKLAPQNVAVAWPGYQEIYDSIIRSGYTESDDEYRKTRNVQPK